jgi:DNA polymerase-3 subunit epsilon
MYKYQDKYNDNVDGKKLRIATILDTETTGLDVEKDDIINIGLMNIEFDDDGNLYSIVNGYNGFQKPRVPISNEITEITGITNEMLEGQSFDHEKINEILSESCVVIAHNALFDRGFVDRYFPLSKTKIWCCSMSDISWKSFNINSRRLIDIAIYFGFYFKAHRAITDVAALIHILSKSFSNVTVMKSLVDAIDKQYVRLDAVGAPFETKERLKIKKYKWDFVRKVWFKIVPTSVSMFEKEFLEREIYDRNPRYTVTPIPRSEVYSNW